MDLLVLDFPWAAFDEYIQPACCPAEVYSQFLHQRSITASFSIPIALFFRGCFGYGRIDRYPPKSHFKGRCLNSNHKIVPYTDALLGGLHQ
jgi:hypothetical protein